MNHPVQAQNFRLDRAAFHEKSKSCEATINRMAAIGVPDDVIMDYTSRVYKLRGIFTKVTPEEGVEKHFLSMSSLDVFLSTEHCQERINIALKELEDYGLDTDAEKFREELRQRVNQQLYLMAPPVSRDNLTEMENYLNGLYRAESRIQEHLKLNRRPVIKKYLDIAGIDEKTVITSAHHDAFLLQISEHDYFYEQRSDMIAWRRGLAERKAIDDAVKVHPHFKAMWELYKQTKENGALMQQLREQTVQEETN